MHILLQGPVPTLLLRRTVPHSIAAEGLDQPNCHLILCTTSTVDHDDWRGISKIPLPKNHRHTEDNVSQAGTVNFDADGEKVKNHRSPGIQEFDRVSTVKIVFLDFPVRVFPWT